MSKKKKKEKRLRFTFSVKSYLEINYNSHPLLSEVVLLNHSGCCHGALVTTLKVWVKCWRRLGSFILILPFEEFFFSCALHPSYNLPPLLGGENGVAGLLPHMTL